MCSNSSTRQIASRSRRRSPRRPSTADGVTRRGPWVNLSRSVESSRFERTVRTESSEIFSIYGGARRVGRVDLHYGRFEVHGTLLLEVDLTDDELQQIIDQIDEELVQTHDPEREDFLVTVFKAEELGFYSDEYEGDDEAGEDEEEER